MKQMLLALLALALITACSPQSSSGLITPLPTGDGSVKPSPTLQPLSTRVAGTLAAQRANATPTLVAATPTPLNNNLPLGSARALAYATDTSFQPTPRSRVEFSEEPIALKFDEFYSGYNIRTGLQLSDKLVSLDGKEVVIEGYMAPPLKAELDFFVLTRVQLATCPFCTTAGDWPDDIAMVYMPLGETIPAIIEPIRIVGQIEVGLSQDAETGMVSLVRLYAKTLEVIR